MADDLAILVPQLVLSGRVVGSRSAQEIPHCQRKQDLEPGVDFSRVICVITDTPCRSYSFHSRCLQNIMECLSLLLPFADTLLYNMDARAITYGNRITAIFPSSIFSNLLLNYYVSTVSSRLRVPKILYLFTSSENRLVVSSAHCGLASY